MDGQDNLKASYRVSFKVPEEVKVPLAEAGIPEASGRFLKTYKKEIYTTSRLLDQVRSRIIANDSYDGYMVIDLTDRLENPLYSNDSVKYVIKLLRSKGYSVRYKGSHFWPFVWWGWTGYFTRLIIRLF